MAGMSYAHEKYTNVATYAMFETLSFASFGGTINAWRRKKMHLPAVYFGSGASQAVVQARIPFSAMWSPSFLPKPHDWPEQCRVVGTFTEPASEAHVDEEEFQDLIEWLQAGPKPVFVGFGSMVIADTTQLSKIIRKAARDALCRIVVQSSWSKLDVSKEPLCFNVGPCPHDWLLPMCCAVIHHGGAGTTAAGLRHGLPTFVCPFFADQFMWAEMVHRAGVGPAPVPVNQLTVEILVEKLSELKSDTLMVNAMNLSQKMSTEDGVKGGLQHFFDYLPRDNLCCDVSLIIGETHLASYRYQRNDVKISKEVAGMLRESDKTPVTVIDRSVYMFTNFLKIIRHAFDRPLYGVRRHAITTYALGNAKTVRQGFFSGLSGCFYGIVKSSFEFYQRPDKLARAHGAFGCLFGLVVAPFNALWLLVYGVLVHFLDRCLLGIANGCFGDERLYCFDRSVRYNIYSSQPVEAELKSLPRPVGSRRLKLRLALQLAMTARTVFDSCRPKYPEGHWHFKVVPAECIAAKLEGTTGDKTFKMELRPTERETLMVLLKKEGTKNISFSRFCLFIGVVTSARLNCETNPRTRTLSFAERYCSEATLEHSDPMKTGRRRTTF